MTRILAIDPGTRVLGWAIFTDRLLTHCGVSVVGAGLKEKRLGDFSMLHVADLNPLFAPLGPFDIVVELPKVYPVGQQKGDQNDLIAITAVGCLVASRFATASPTFYHPQEWKGQVPKDVSHRRIEKRLSKDEQDVAKKQLPKTNIRHNGMDAIGIGLKHAGRSLK